MRSRSVIINNKNKLKWKIKFCEQIASYANANGGLLIVGISDKPPRRIVGIKDLEDKLKFSKEVITTLIDHTADFFHFQQIIIKDISGTDRDCLIIAISETKDVIPVKDNRGNFSCPIRLATGSAKSSYSKIEKSKEKVLRDNYQFIHILNSLLND